MNKSENIEKLAKALADFQGEVKNPKNTAVNPYFRSKYAPLESVLELVRPLLSKNGLSIVQMPGGDGNLITVQTVLMHTSGQWLDCGTIGLFAEISKRKTKPGDDVPEESEARPTPQGGGKAITYARRYSTAAVLAIAGEDDTDGHEGFPANGGKTAPQKPQKNAPSKPQEAPAPSKASGKGKDTGKKEKPAQKAAEGEKGEPKAEEGQITNIQNLQKTLEARPGGKEAAETIMKDVDTGSLTRKGAMAVAKALGSAIQENIMNAAQKGA